MIAVGSIMCALAAIGSEVLWAGLVVVGLDEGSLVIYGFYFAYAASILGVLAIAMITIRRRVLKGYVYAVLSIILAAPFLVLDYGFRSQAKVRAQHKKEWSGLYNLELLGKELIRYAEDNDGRLPVADKWCDLLMQQNPELTDENFKHPRPEEFAHLLHFEGECQFAFNSNLGGMPLADVPGNVVLLFEADGPWNLAGTKELLQTRYREKGYIAVLFGDQSTANYWYYTKATRKFSEDGKHMYYEELRWKP